MNKNELENIWKNGMMGLVVGDALGVPVQFMTREEIRDRSKGPVKGMESGGVYNMPEGTWSDDSSMALCALDGILECSEPVPEDIMKRFVRWEVDGEYTPAGITFDQGNTCTEAIYKFMKTQDTTSCGKTGEYANGNGALMRILPVCMYYALQQLNKKISTREALCGVDQISVLTHNHTRSKAACRFYYFIVRMILMDILYHGGNMGHLDMIEAYRKEGTSKDRTPLNYLIQQGLYDGFQDEVATDGDEDEMYYFRRIFRVESLKVFGEEDIKSSGYVVDSLEAALWCLIKTDNYRDCMLKAVNLGDDTDTIAAIAGGIAGLYYGYESIPKEWLEVIKRREWIEDMCEKVQEK